jgi:hypothetical protein
MNTNMPDPATITVSIISLSDEALNGLSYHPEARVRLAAHREIDRRKARCICLPSFVKVEDESELRDCPKCV